MARTVSRRAVCVAAMLALCCAGAMAQGAWPSKVIRMVVPFAPGGSSDVIVRPLCDKLSELLGQSVVPDYVPGAGGTVSAAKVASAAPDGYTLLLASNPQAFGATLYSKLSFDPVEDFAAISLFGREPGVLVVNPNLPVKTLAEFIAYVKARPGQVDFASSGNGSAQHVFMAMFMSAAGLKMTHIPYRGSAQAVTDVVAGQVPVTLPGLAAMVPHIREHRLRALAVTGSSRSPLLPDVPTLAESGFPDISAYVWSGLVAPKGTPPAIIDRLNHELKVAMRSPTVTAFMNNASVETITDTPAEFQAFFREEKARSAKVIKDAGLGVD
jgi:tripartite-type tricarboxylate transporter receptor subunit TctC